jgi:two-component system sensor histidine kinase and response regulator WspE
MTKLSCDPALLDLFRAEIDTHLPALNEGLLSLEKTPGEAKQLEALMRAAHSIKGAARIVGVEPAVRLAHAMEDCFVAAQEGRLTLASDAIDVLLRGVDGLHRITLPGDGGSGELTDDDLDQLLADLDAVRQGRAVVATAAAPPEVEAPARTGPPAVRPSGKLDAAGAESVRGRLIELFRQAVPLIQLDLAEVSDIDPAGLALLAAAARRAASATAPVALEVVNAPPAVRRLLSATRLDRVYTMAGEGA